MKKTQTSVEINGQIKNQYRTRMEELVPLICDRIRAGQSVRFSPRGTSMLPMLRQGKDSVVLSAPPVRLRKYDIPLYRREDGSYILHRIVKVGETYTCMGDHQYVEEKNIRPEQIIAVVTAFDRGERTISTKNLLYKIYCRIWHYSRFPRRCLRRVKRFVCKM